MIDSHQNRYARIAVDVIVENDEGKILIGRSREAPIKHKWVLSCFYIKITDNNIEATIIRGLKQDLDLDVEVTHLVDVLGDPKMKPIADPRFYTVQALYLAKPVDKSEPYTPSQFIDSFKWISPSIARFKKLGFNHNFLIKKYLQNKAERKLIPVQRSMYDVYFDEELEYEENENYMHTVVMGIVLNDKDEILLGHRAQNPFKDAWDFPGGHMYSDESLTDCLVREVQEELGVDCIVDNLFNIYSDKGMSPRFSRAMVLYFIRLRCQDFVKNIEIDDFAYFSLDQLPENIAYHCDGVLEDIRKYVEHKKKI